MRLLLSLIILSCCAMSCATFTQVTISRNENVYAASTRAGGNISAYNVSQRTRATLREDGDLIIVTPVPADSANIDFMRVLTDPALAGGFALPGSRGSTGAPYSYFFSTREGLSSGNDNRSLHYTQFRIYLQGLALPLKFRKAKDGLSRMAEAGPTFALAPGIKHSWVWFRGSKGSLGLNATSFSVATGALLGVGLVDINSKTTLGKVPDAKSTKNAIIPAGIHFTVGLNNINIGVAFGRDFITGPNRKHWVYKGENWTGLIVGLDIIK